MVKVSPDGAAFVEALRVGADGSVALPQGALIQNGTAAQPALRFASDTDTGLARPGPDQIALICGGQPVATLSGGGLQVDVPLSGMGTQSTSHDATAGRLARAGLAALRSQSRLVAIHDAARPLVQPHTIEAVIRAAATHGAAIAARRVHDTIKRSPDGHSERETLDRALLWAAQTPQVFERARYTDLALQAAQANWTPTDDAALWERWEGPVQLVDGGAHNLKLTTPEDLLVARAICRARAMHDA
jgi:hypothetical protein